MNDGRIYTIKHKGTGHQVERIRCKAEDLQRAIDSIAEEHEYAPYDLLAEEETGEPSK